MYLRNYMRVEGLLRGAVTFCFEVPRPHRHTPECRLMPDLSHLSDAKRTLLHST